MQDIFKVNPELVKEIEWTGDGTQYDLDLYSLGEDEDAFMVTNPWSKNIKLLHLIKEIPNSNNKCIIWKHNNEWLAKLFRRGWEPEDGYEEIELIKPKFAWRKNQDLDRTMTFEDDPFGVYEPEIWDSHYELVWYMDPRFNPLPDKIWAISCKPIGKQVKGVKDMGYVTPDVNVEYNEELPVLDIDLDSLYPPYYDLAHECCLMLDEKYTPFEKVWVVKFSPAYRKPKPLMWMGVVTPEFKVVYNKELPKVEYDIEYQIPWRDLKYEHVWLLDNKHTVYSLEKEIWAVKIVTTESPKGVKTIGEVSPNLIIEYNPELPRANYDIDYTIPYHDLAFEHVWMLDKKHTVNAPEDIWAVKVRAVKKPAGVKIMDKEVDLQLEYEYNPELPKLTYNIDYTVQYHDMQYEHVWMLDKKHCLTAPNDIWAVKITPSKEIIGTKFIGDISPIPRRTVNPAIKGFTFTTKYDECHQYHDFAYTHTWMLDKNYSGEYDIWAIRLNYVDKPIGDKNNGWISPEETITYNKDLKGLQINIDYEIPYHDMKYVHVWYLDKNFTSGKKIWAAKMVAVPNASGEKDMGIITPVLPENLDVIFISYNEANAEENWQRVLEKAPYAKRVDGVKGIFEAHKAAADIAETDMFYVVDGDAYLSDQWKFNYQPGLFDRDCAYVWSSRNPINDLIYGYGGVKLFSRSVLLKVNKWKGLDMTTSVMPKLKVISKISNDTRFNTDEFSTWRSAFRECVKLCYNIAQQTDNQEHQTRLDKWLSLGEDRPFGKIAMSAAAQAVEFAKKNINKINMLSKINNQEWLEQIYKKDNRV